jgi:hypothetical protein
MVQALSKPHSNEPTTTTTSNNNKTTSSYSKSYKMIRNRTTSVDHANFNVIADESGVEEVEEEEEELNDFSSSFSNHHHQHHQNNNSTLRMFNSKAMSRENSKSLNNITTSGKCGNNKLMEDDRIPKMSIGSRRIMGYSNSQHNLITYKKRTSAASTASSSSSATKDNSIRQPSMSSNNNIKNDQDRILNEDASDVKMNKVRVVNSSSSSSSSSSSATSSSCENMQQEIRLQTLLATNSESSSSSANQISTLQQKQNDTLTG